MSFTARDIIHQFRLDIDDYGGDTSGYINDWENLSSELMIKNEQALRFFNQVRLEFSIRRPIVDATTDEDANSLPLTEITLVADTRDYAYSPLIQTIDKVALNSTGYELRKLSPDSLDDYARNWRSLSGTPKFYVEDLAGNRTISFIPKPSAADTIYMTVRRLVTAPVTWANRNTALTEPDDTWQEALIQGMKQFAYMVQDSDVRNLEMALGAQTLFSQMVGPPLSAEEVENRRLSANLRLHYRPTESFYRGNVRYNRRYRPDRYW